MTDLRNAAKDVLDELDGMRDGRYSVFLGVSPANRESLREALAKNANAAQYSDLVSDGGLDPRNASDVAAPQDQDAKNAAMDQKR